MELLLNLFWLMVVLAGLAAWRLRWSKAHRDCDEFLRGAIGLGCVLLLLFPVISLTDDLHAVPLVSEEARSSRRVLQTSKGGQTDSESGNLTAPFAAAISPAPFSFASVVVGQLVLADAGPPQMAPQRLSQGRAPPFFPPAAA